MKVNAFRGNLEIASFSFCKRALRASVCWIAQTHLRPLLLAKVWWVERTGSR